MCKGQIYKTAEIIFLCHKVLCLFCTVIFTSELIAKRHSLSCHYKCDYTRRTVMTLSNRRKLVLLLVHVICYLTYLDVLSCSEVLYPRWRLCLHTVVLGMINTAICLLWLKASYHNLMCWKVFSFVRMDSMAEISISFSRPMSVRFMHNLHKTLVIFCARSLNFVPMSNNITLTLLIT